jgi:hypothetical protein
MANAHCLWLQVEGIAALANAPNQEMAKRIVKLEEENKSLRKGCAKL